MLDSEPTDALAHSMTVSSAKSVTLLEETFRAARDVATPSQIETNSVSKGPNVLLQLEELKIALWPP